MAVLDVVLPQACRGVARVGYNVGNWRVDKHSRFVEDITGDGTADIVRFSNSGTWVSEWF
ncbi:MAG TPA: hypothetical protein VFI43_00065 [Nitrosospira sp.]|nr:hypothetical protein [Nitrosospira sp.]